MSEFVNYNKRAVTLPPGCKNLIDVLQGEKPGTTSRPYLGDYGKSFRPRKKQFATNGLAQVERNVIKLLTNPREIYQLFVSSLDRRTYFSLNRIGEHEPFATAWFSADKQQEKPVRAFFDQRGIQPVMDQVTQQYEGFEPVRLQRLLVYPLPFDAPQASALTIELLRQVFGLNDESGLEFLIFEPEAES